LATERNWRRLRGILERWSAVRHEALCITRQLFGGIGEVIRNAMTALHFNCGRAGVLRAHDPDDHDLRDRVVSNGQRLRFDRR